LFWKSKKRRLNEGKFLRWEELSAGGRKYWYEVNGRWGYTARYVKEVDEEEETVRFYQEIYDEKGNVVEIHEKYPINKGHQKIEKGAEDGRH
jgi:hypothetical protein